MRRHFIRSRNCLMGALALLFPHTASWADSKPFLSPSTASAVVVASTSSGGLIVLPTMTGPALKLGGPGAVAVSPHGNLVYAAPEWGRRTGHLLTVSLTGRRLKELSSVRLGGSGAVSIAVAPDARSLVVANYSSSSVSVVRLDLRGMPTEVIAVRTHIAPSNPHAVVFLGATAVVTDLRNDRVDFLSIDANPKWVGSVLMRPGDGPRSIAVVNDRQFLVSNELSNSVSCLLSDKGSFSERGRVDLGGSAISGPSASSPPRVAPPTAMRPKPAEIVVTSATAAAVVVRGSDELVRLSFGPECQLGVVARESDVVDRPRPLVNRGAEIWMGISTAVMVTGSRDNWGAIATRDPVYSMVVVR